MFYEYWFINIGLDIRIYEIEKWTKQEGAKNINLVVTYSSVLILSDFKSKKKSKEPLYN